MDVQGFLTALKADPAYAGQMVHVHTEPARTATWAELPSRLGPEARAFAGALGAPRLYAHQAEAIEAALDGRNVLLSTGTASGKSLCYQLPVVQQLVGDPDATALFIFPAKALARDQSATWNHGCKVLSDLPAPQSFMAAPYDGDSSASDRRIARDAARLLVTNPDMLHANMVPGHGRWPRFLRGLKTIVIDEVHSYTGFFGANMANLLRRLDRVCAHYGSHPQVTCCSATVGNPTEVAELLTGRPFHVIDKDTSAAGARTFVFWNPPRIKKRQWRGRRSANVEAHELMARLIRQGIPTICFSKARNTAEMIYRYVRETLEAEAPGLATKVIPYRGGYSGAERRRLERELKEGKLLGVSATRALELGIDIGMLEACLIVGYPGILNAFFQQAGRAGRALSDSLCILIGVDTAINQYIMAHPQYVFDRPIERVVIDRDNPFVVLGHVRCATAELPVGDTEVDRFGYAAPLALEVLEANHKVHHGPDGWYHAANETPAFEVRLRGYGDSDTVVVDAGSGEVIDRLDTFRAMRLFYEGAIYFHHGDTYARISHDTERHVVTIKKVDVSYYTDPVTGTAVNHIDTILDQRPIGTGQAFLGEVYAVLDTPVYEKVKFYTLDRISQHPTGLPSIAYEAMSFWVTPPDTLVSQMLAEGLHPESGMRGILFCVSRILPLFLTCDQNDFDWTLGCRNSPWHTMFWFEFYLQGIGNAEQCFDRLELILSVALEHLLTCDCEDGCTNCTTRLITPYHVRNIELGEGEGPFSRRSGAVLLNSMLYDKTLQESVALVNTPRAERGQRFLPAVIDRPRLTAPNRMPLNERTRQLMTRKLERARHAQPAVDHAIDPIPPVGAVAESATTLPESDPERRAGRAAIRHRADPLTRKLRQRLSAVAATTPAPAAPPPPPAPGLSSRASQPSGASAPRPAPHDLPAVPAGDSVARRARLRGRKRPRKAP